MTQRQDKKQAKKQDPDTTLAMHPFDIPNVTTLKAVMVAERKAFGEVQHDIAVMTTPSTSLIDPQGKPIPQLGGDIRAKVKAMIDGLLRRPILSRAYSIGYVDADGGQSLASFEPAGIKLAFLTYQGLSMLLVARIGQQMAMQLANQLDVMFVLSMQAIHNHRNPLRILEKILVLKGKDPKTGVDLIGEPEWAADLRLAISDLFISFMVAGGYAATTLDSKETAARVALDDSLPFMNLTESGDALYHHLRDQIALKVTLTTRGPVLVQEEGEKPETKTLAQVNKDMDHTLRNIPDNKLHQA